MLAQRLHQRRFLHDLAPGDVDEPRRGLHGRQLRGADEAASLIRQREGHHHEVGPCQRPAHRARPVDGARLAHPPAAAAHAHHRHGEAPRRAGDGAPDIAEPDDADRGAVEPGRVLAHPAALTLTLTEGLHPLGDPEAPAENVFRHPGPEDAGGSRDGHAGGDLGNKESLDARPHALDPAEPGGPGQERRRDPPAIQDLGLGDHGIRLRGSGAGDDRRPAAREPDEARIVAGLLRVIDEDRGRRHAPSVARSWSSNAKSTRRVARPSARYHSQVRASPEWSV